MNTEIDDANVEHHGPSYLTIWIYLLVLTAVEVVLAYEHLFSAQTMLIVLMILSVVKAALIIAYFMHLKSERTSLILSLMPAVILVICLLFAFFPDSYRLFELRVR